MATHDAMDAPQQVRLTSDDVRAYRANGFLVLRALFSPSEVERLAADANALAARGDVVEPENLRCRFQPHPESGESSSGQEPTRREVDYAKRGPRAGPPPRTTHFIERRVLLLATDEDLHLRSGPHALGDLRAGGRLCASSRTIPCGGALMPEQRRGRPQPRPRQPLPRPARGARGQRRRGSPPGEPERRARRTRRSGDAREHSARPQARRAAPAPHDGRRSRGVAPAAEAARPSGARGTRSPSARSPTTDSSTRAASTSWSRRGPSKRSAARASPTTSCSSRPMRRVARTAAPRRPDPRRAFRVTPRRSRRRRRSRLRRCSRSNGCRSRCVGGGVGRRRSRGGAPAPRTRSSGRASG
jgi:hypothetical protein